MAQNKSLLTKITSDIHKRYGQPKRLKCRNEVNINKLIERLKCGLKV